MIARIHKRPLVCSLQVKVHVLLDKALPFKGNSVVKHYLVLKLRNSRAFNRCGMCDYGIQVKLVIVQLSVYAKFPVSSD
ncbi:MAG: hypothetical protein KHX59_06285 [Prevotella sp.]|nr:hypothetical protein [Prevotella sp.]